MMAEMRHNFTQVNILSTQVIELLRQNLCGIFKYPQSIIFETIKWAEKPWHSPTYDGRVDYFTIRLSRKKIGNETPINYKLLNKTIENHEFIMRKSFVAAIEITKVEQSQNTIDIEIEAVIIFEE